MKINYNNNGNFVWDKESAQKEMLDYMLQDYSANEPDNAGLIANALKPEKMEENNNQSSNREFGRVTYGNILTSGFNSLKTLKVDEIDEIISLSKETRRLLLVVDEDLTLAQLSDEKTRAKVLGITGNVRSLEDTKLEDSTPKDAGFDFGPRTKKESKLSGGKKLMNDILEGEGVSETNKPISDTKTTKKKATWKSWTLDEDKFKVNNPYETGSQITIQELKVATLKDMGYSQINFTPTYTRSKTGSRRKGNFSQIDRPKKLGPDRNLLESKTGTQTQRQAALRNWESQSYKEGKGTNGIVLRRFSAQIKVAKNLQIILQELTEYESKGTDEEGKAIETDEDKKTGKVELIDWSEKVDAKTKKLKPHKLMVAFSNLKNEYINEDADKLKETSEEYKKLLEVDAKIDNLYDAKINLNKPKENKELNEVVELLRTQGIPMPPKLKQAFKIKSENLLDAALKDMDRKFKTRRNTVEKKYKSNLEALETELKKHISKYEKEEKKLIKDKKDFGDNTLSEEETEEFKESNVKRFRTSKEAKDIYEDMENFVKKFFKENIENLFKVFSYSIQVEKIEATKEEKGEKKVTTTYKIKTIEAREITTITVSKGITQQEGKEGRSKKVVEPMSVGDKQDLSLFLKLLQKRYRKLNQIIQ